MIVYCLFLLGSLVSGTSLHECDKSLGLETGQVKDGQLSVSSSFDSQSTGPQNARIRTETGSGAWCPQRQINGTVHEWIQVEFPAEMLISAVETQGRYDNGRGAEYAMAYMIEYWRNSLGIWQRYKDSAGNEILAGNTNTRTAVKRVLESKLVANLVRIIPVSEFTRTVCLRFELYGCVHRPHELLEKDFEKGPLVDDHSLSYFSVNTEDRHEGENLKWIVLSIIAASTFGILSIAVLLYLLLCTRQILNRNKPAGNKLNNSYFSPVCQKNVEEGIQCETTKRYVTPPIPFVYANRYDSGFVDKQQMSASSSSESSSDYAEPDCENLSEPLIKICSLERFAQNSDSMHYASSPVRTAADNEPPQQPLSSFERFAYINRKLLCEAPVMEFNSKALNLIESIGDGEFGNLHVCTLNRLRHVLVKYAKQDSCSLKGFEREKRVMSQLNHQNVCVFFGIVNTNGLIFEFPSQGDLPNWLRKQDTISQKQLLFLTTQIAAGMAYFESLGFVHRDLAARNCFVSADESIKIADVAVFNSNYADDYYRLVKDKTTQILPIRWMAWESVETTSFTSHSDTWSLAVTIWEVFGLCTQRPYSQLTDSEVLNNLSYLNRFGRLKHQLECYEDCPKEVYEQILEKCWVRTPEQRLSSAEVHRRLQKYIIKLN